MNRKLFLLTLSGVLILLTACSPLSTRCLMGQMQEMVKGFISQPPAPVVIPSATPVVRILEE